MLMLYMSVKMIYLIKEIKNMWNMPNKLIGISTHNLKQARIAEANGADYIGIGPYITLIVKEILILLLVLKKQTE